MTVRQPLFPWAMTGWLGLLLPLSVLAAQIPETGRPSNAYRSDRILVKPNSRSFLAKEGHWIKRHGHHVLKEFPNIERWQVIQLANGISVDEAIASCLESGTYDLAEPDYQVHAALLPNDPEFINGALWGLRNIGLAGGTMGADINAPAAWSLAHEATNVIVAVVDSGIRITHEDLEANLWTNPGEIPGNEKDDDHNGIIDDVHGINAIDNSGNVSDESGHGTHIAGTIGAVGNNEIGTAGVLWKARLMACKFLGPNGIGYVSDAVQCLDYARAKGAKIINASWFDTQSSEALLSAIATLRQRGILLVAAAGNGGNNIDTSLVYPACFELDNIISVAATTRQDALAINSNYGALMVDLGAPGNDIYGPWRTGDRSYAYLNGTSAAAPFVSGAAALLMARYPTETHKLIRNRLLATVEPIPALQGKCVTGGRLDLHQALGPAAVAKFAAAPTNGAVPLTVAFQNQSTGLIAQIEWDFGDGTTVTNESSPNHIYAQEGRFVATLKITGPDDSVYTASNVISSVAQYQIDTPQFAWIETNDLDRIVLGNNSVSSALPIPFPFHLYGNRYDHALLSANGMLGFVSNGLAAYKNLELPNPTAPRAVLCPYWDDLSPASGDGIYWGVVGREPARMFIASWIRVPVNGYSTAKLTFQVLLDEFTQQVTYQYLEVAPTHVQGGGRSATIGLQDETGQIGLQYSYLGSPQLLANGMALRFHPTSASPMVVFPSESQSMAAFEGGPFSPDQIQFTLSNSGSQPLIWAAQTDGSWLVLTPPGGSLDPGQSVAIHADPSAEARDLMAGSYTNHLFFLDQSTGLGHSMREVRLEVGSAIPLRLEISSPMAVGQILLQLQGASLISYTLEQSIDCLSWLPVATNITTLDGTTTFTEPFTPGPATRFYRARRLID